MGQFNTVQGHPSRTTYDDSVHPIYTHNPYTKHPYTQHMSQNPQLLRQVNQKESTEFYTRGKERFFLFKKKNMTGSENWSELVRTGLAVLSTNQNKPTWFSANHIQPVSLTSVVSWKNSLVVSLWLTTSGCWAKETQTAPCTRSS